MFRKRRTEPNEFEVVVSITHLTLTGTSNGTMEGTLFMEATTLFQDKGSRQCAQPYNAAYQGLLIPLGDGLDAPVVRAGFDSPLGITAALYSLSPCCARVVKAPDEVMELVRDQGPCRQGHTSKEEFLAEEAAWRRRQRWRPW